MEGISPKLWATQERGQTAHPREPFFSLITPGPSECVLARWLAGADWVVCRGQASGGGWATVPALEARGQPSSALNEASGRGEDREPGWPWEGQGFRVGQRTSCKGLPGRANVDRLQIKKPAAARAWGCRGRQWRGPA